MPRGFLTDVPPAFYAIETIEDASGAVLAHGDDPRPGEWGFLGIKSYAGPGPGHDPKRPKEVRQFFRFGIR